MRRHLRRIGHSLCVTLTCRSVDRSFLQGTCLLMLRFLADLPGTEGAHRDQRRTLRLAREANPSRPKRIEPSVSTARPHSTGMSRSRATRVNSSASRVLPTSGSPPHSTSLSFPRSLILGLFWLVELGFGGRGCIT
jgi:hypothetical protein